MFVQLKVRGSRLLSLVMMANDLHLMAGCDDARDPAPTGINAKVADTNGGEPLGNVELNFVSIDGDTQKAIFAQPDGEGRAVISDHPSNRIQVMSRQNGCWRPRS